jgi:hypothetical protein
MTAVIKSQLLSSIALGLVSIAGIASANESREVTINSAQVEYNADTMVVKVTGNLPNLCVVAPRPQLALTEKANVLALEVKADASTDNCIETVGVQYQLGFDIRSLKFDLEALKIDTDATYTILANHGTLAMTVDFSKVPYTRPFATNIVPHGVLTVENDGRFTIAVSESEAFSVKSPIIDLHKFIGQPVSLEGHVVNVRGTSVINDPSVAKQVLLVTGLSSTQH